MAENTEKIPEAYLENMLLASLSAFIGSRVQTVNATLPVDELNGDYLAGLVSGLTHEEREFFAASLDAQVIICGLTNASVITEPHDGPGPHWISAMYLIKYDGNAVHVNMDVIACGC
jgi:hypothetical protein